jgi:hypothetical protein
MQKKRKRVLWERTEEKAGLRGRDGRGGGIATVFGHYALDGIAHGVHTLRMGVNIINTVCLIVGNAADVPVYGLLSAAFGGFFQMPGGAFGFDFFIEYETVCKIAAQWRPYDGRCDGYKQVKSLFPAETHRNDDAKQIPDYC